MSQDAANTEKDADGRFTVAFLRRLLGAEAEVMSDEDVLKLRDEMYSLADLVIDAAMKELKHVNTIQNSIVN